jgi:hypothetical protein
VLLDEVLIGKFGAIDGLATSAIACGEITTLNVEPLQRISTIAR